MRLAYWRSVWYDGEFDPNSGDVRRYKLASPREASSSLPGFFAVERSTTGARVVLALYQVNGILFFQANGKRWPLHQPGLQFRHQLRSWKLVSTFQVMEGGRIVWPFTYLHPLRTFYAHLDPTYDAIEFDRDHFLAFVTDNALNLGWQANVRKHWAPTQVAP